MHDLVGVYTAMFCCNIYPLQTWFPLFAGTVIEPLGITLLAVAINRENQGFIYGMLALTGVGTGIRFMPGMYLHPSFTVIIAISLLVSHQRVSLNP